MANTANHTANRKALQEFWQGLGNWRLWSFLGWQNIRQRYQRTFFGPFWLTLSMAIFVTAIGAVFSRLLGSDIAEYFPFLAAGYLTWFFISATLNESCTVFLSASNYIKDMKIPLSIFPAKLVWKNFLIFLHNSLVVVVVNIIFHVNPGWNLLFLIPGLILLLLNSLWISCFLGMLATRFGDIPPMVQSIVQILFFISPIAWMKARLGGDSLIVDLNPVYYFLELIRRPLLGEAPNYFAWEVTAIMLVVGWLVVLLMYMRLSRKLIFWL